MGRLRDRFLNVPVDAVLHSASASAQQAAAEQKDRATRALVNSMPVGKKFTSFFLLNRLGTALAGVARLIMARPWQLATIVVGAIAVVLAASWVNEARRTASLSSQLVEFAQTRDDLSSQMNATAQSLDELRLKVNAAAQSLDSPNLPPKSSGVYAQLKEIEAILATLAQTMQQVSPERTQPVLQPQQRK
jgi:hypothetical protein